MKNIDEKILTEMYYDKKTLKELSVFFECSVATISNHIKKLGLSRKKKIEENTEVLEQKDVQNTDEIKPTSKELKIAKYLEKLLLK